MSREYFLGLACDGDCRQDGCPKCGYKLGIGDAVEVRVLQRSAFKAGPVETWLPSTVTAVTDREIYVAFSDGDRVALPREMNGGPKQWRTVK